ncbi:MAG: TolC family protein, partial [Vicinamibacteria bacterium]
LPLGNRAASSRYAQADLGHRRAMIDKGRFQQMVALEVREAARNVQTDVQQIETTRAFREFAEEQLRAEQKKLEVGLSTSHVVLDFQEDLAAARVREVEALIGYNISRTILEAAKGTTLEANDIVFEDQVGIR